MAVKLVVRHPNSALSSGEVCFEFEQARVVIGRSSGADVRLPGLTVSDLHATLEIHAGQVRLRDEGSTNGTRINGVALVPSRARSLVPGDEIEIGEFTIRFESGPLLGTATSPERTASLARRLLRELLGPDSSASAPPCLRVTKGPEEGTVINLADPPSRLLIGRGEEVDLALTDPDVSREHLEIVRNLDTAIARDLGSKNGLDINGKRLRERRLRHGDCLRIGDTVISYEDPTELALKDLEGQPDRTLTRTREGSVSVPASAAEEAATLPADTPKPPGPPPATSTQSTDLLIYGLAAFVLLASLAGLVWLFR